ncbi:lymphocyte activation gene 3 protein [Sorex araneus]|uniref:lymphocyte activation gene 3 protein n=1 Tax=Sorex araneus TaxID=42254 RepID=UPI002433C730|nr:lymphocyte activation gene 3 protein [Sorex araneus]
MRGPLVLDLLLLLLLCVAPGKGQEVTVSLRSLGSPLPHLLAAPSPSPWPLFSCPGQAAGPEAQVQVVWAPEGGPAQLPCSSASPLQGLDLRIREVLWQHFPDSAPPGASPGPAAGPAPRGYTVLRLTPGGVRSGKQPLQPRVQLQERGLQRGDFSLWLRPARRADAGEYRASVSLRDRGSVSCHLRLRVGQASLTVASPSGALGALRSLDWVVLNCSFSRPDLPASVRWFRGAGRAPVLPAAHLYAAGSFLFLPHVGPADSGLWGCVLAYRDGFNVSITSNLTVLGLTPAAPLTVYAAAGTRAELPCHLPPEVGTQSPLSAQWSPPGGGPDLLVPGDRGNFTLRLDAVSRAQSGTYTCHVHLQGQGLQVTVTLAVITVTPKSSGFPGSVRQPFCEVSPSSGRERFVWSALGRESEGSTPGPWLPLQDTSLPSQPWQCQLYQGDRLLGTALYFPEHTGPGAWSSGGAPGASKAARLPLFLTLGGSFLLLLGAGAYGFHLWRRQTISQWRPRRFSALEQGVHPPEAQGKREELELEDPELEPEDPELEPGTEPEPEPELEPAPELELAMEPGPELK